MNLRTVVLAGALVLALAGCASPSAGDMASATTSAPMKDAASPTTRLQSAEPRDPVAAASAENDEAASGPGSYIALADYLADQAAYAGTDVVLFFNAEWCSTCKVARDNIEGNPGSIPPDLTIVAVDFDNAGDLRQKYGVTVQHTFVQIDAVGNELAKWSGSVTAGEIAQRTV